MAQSEAGRGVGARAEQTVFRESELDTVERAARRSTAGEEGTASASHVEHSGGAWEEAIAERLVRHRPARTVNAEYVQSEIVVESLPIENVDLHHPRSRRASSFQCVRCIDDKRKAPDAIQGLVELVGRV